MTSLSGRRARIATGCLALLGLAPSLLACWFPEWEQDEPETSWDGTALFVHRGEEPEVDLQLRWPTLGLDCAALEARFEGALDRDAFGPGTTYRVRRGATVPIDAPPDLGFDVRDGACPVAWVAAPGLAPRLVRWTVTASGGLPVELERGAFVRAPVLALEGGEADRSLVVESGEVQVLRADAAPPACPTPAAPLEWSGPFRGGTYTVDVVERGADGCVHVELGDEAGANERHVWCLPAGAMPFVAGDTIVVPPEAQFRQRLVAATADGRVTLVAGSGGTPAGAWGDVEGRFSLDGIDAVALRLDRTPTACAATRRLCGALTRALDVRVLTPRGTPRSENVVWIPPTGEAPGATWTVFVPRAEEVLATVDGCAGAYASTGVALDWVTVAVVDREEGE